MRVPLLFSCWCWHQSDLTISTLTSIPREGSSARQSIRNATQGVPHGCVNHHKTNSDNSDDIAAAAADVEGSSNIMMEGGMVHIDKGNGVEQL